MTTGFISIVAIIITLYDIWMLWRRGYEATISWVLLTWSRKYPIIAFMLGVLAGHIFWPNMVVK